MERRPLVLPTDPATDAASVMPVRRHSVTEEQYQADLPDIPKLERRPLVLPKPERKARVPIALTEARVRKLKTQPGMYSDGASPGLWLRVTTTHHGQWVHRYQFRGTRREMGLGSTDIVTLEEARAACLEARRMMRPPGVNDTPVDPLTRRRERRAIERQAGTTFAAVAADYISVHKGKWSRARMADEWANSLSTHVPSLMALTIADVDTPRIVKALRPLWVTQNKLGERLRYRIECIWNFAKSSGLVTGDCPARYKHHLANLLPSVERVAAKAHHDSLAYQDINALMRQLEAKPGEVTACLRYTILTAARSGEARGLRWDECDFATRTITIPGTRMKASVAHSIPMSTQVYTLLEAQQAKRKAGDDLVFHGRSHDVVNETSLVHTLRRLGYKTETIHGLRTTFRTWAAECTDYPSEIPEMALSHAVGSAVVQAYQRSTLLERRRGIMQEYAEYCDKIQRRPLPATV